MFTTSWNISNARSTTFLKNPRRNSVFVRGHSQQHDTCIPNVLERKTETPRRTVALACTLCYCPHPPRPLLLLLYIHHFDQRGRLKPSPCSPLRAASRCAARRYTCNLHPSTVRVQSTCEVKPPVISIGSRSREKSWNLFSFCNRARVLIYILKNQLFALKHTLKTFTY